MRNVGVIDYLGLTSALSGYVSRLQRRYTNIIVDEAQDFGTTELRVVRALVAAGPNDIFLCGDIAQTILPKHRSLSEAGFVNIARDRIRQNYRNSREILIAAYEVLRNNLSEDMFDSEDLEILDPKFANFSGPVPMALACRLARRGNRLCTFLCCDEIVSRREDGLYRIRRLFCPRRSGVRAEMWCCCARRHL